MPTRSLKGYKTTASEKHLADLQQTGYNAARFSRPIFFGEGAVQLELPTTHRVPVGWIREKACAPIRWRTLNEILPPNSAAESDVAALREELLQYKRVTQTIRKQRKGVWGGNILGVATAKAQGIKDVGTVASYRHLIELGVPRGERVFRSAERVFHRLLSRDSDPALLFEYKAGAKANYELADWARQQFREGAVAALAQAGYVDDPRVRGAAHKIATAISTFLRSDLAEKPIIRRSNKNVLHPDAHPPTIYSVAMLAHMPGLQRERAGFADRLGAYISAQATKRSYVIQLGRRGIKPTHILLGDPLQASSAGAPKDLPLALHWIELLVRLELLEASTVAQRILARLLRDCDADGVWSPKNVRSMPKSASKVADFAFPLELDGKTVDRRQADVTFRLALIAKLAGWELQFA